MRCVAALIFTIVFGFIPEIASAQTPTTTVLSVSSTTPALGTPVVLTATVSPGTPTGSVTFFDGTTYLGRSTVANATAALQTQRLGAGAHSLTAQYNGDAANNRSTSPAVPVTVIATSGAGLTGGLVAAAPVPVGSQPVSIAYGDLNGDLKPDLVTANQNGNNVSVALGNGDGTFQSAVSYPAGGGPNSVTIADINGDGKLDLVVANGADNTVAILFGNGAGSFGTPVTYSAGSGPRSVAIADYNNDGFPDIAVTSTGTMQISILLNTGTGAGAFGPALNIPLGGSPKGIAAGDFNGDGITDLAVVNYTAVLSHVTILLGTGDGTFSTPTNLNVDSGPFDVIVNDFNGDGKADLAIACFNTNSVDVLLGNGDGTFGPAVASAAGNGPYSLVSTDFDGDGKLDLAAVDNTGNSVTLLLGAGDGTFRTSAVTYATGAAPASLVAADFNGDARADLAVANSTDNSVTILIGHQPTATSLSVSPNPAAPGQTVTLTATVSPGVVTGTVTFFDGATPLGTNPVSGGVATLSTSSLSAGAHVLTAVYNGDANYAPSTSAAVTLNIGGIVTPVLTVTPASSVLGQPVTLTVTVSPNTATGSITFYDGPVFLDETVLVNGQASFTTSLLAAGTHSLVARFDGGNGNLAALTNVVPITVTAAAAGGFTPPTSYAAGTGTTAAIFGDFNRDGVPDIAAANFVAGTVSIFIGNADGTLQPAVNIAVGTNPDALAIGDFNGDGIQDLLIANYGSSNLSLLLGNSDGSFQAPTTIASGAMPSGVAVGDFNGDGFADFAVSETGTNNVSIYSGNGNGTFAAPVPISVGGGLRGIIAANLHGLLTPDLAVAAGSGVYVLLNNGSGSFAAPVLYAAGSGPIAVAAADLGNGSPDLIVVNSLSNNISVLLGNGSGTFQPAVNYAVGTFPQSVAVGDYDGDGKLDLAVANEGSGNGTGSISRLIGNGDGTFQAAVNYPDGANGTPTSVITAALNGTGQSDLAVSNFGGGTVDILLALNASSVSLTANPDPDPTGDPVTLTATVSPANATGTVNFFAGSLALGSAPVVSGVAAITVQIPAGNQSLTAVYGGDAVYGPSTSPAVPDLIGQIATSISLNISPSTATFGTPVTLTATITTPGVTGYVTFFSGTTVLGASPLSSGVAVLQTSLIPAGPQTITARYDGSANFAGGISAGAALNVVAVAGYSFNPPIAVPTGFPISIVASDFNRDGKVDLAVANSGVSLLTGNGDGTFTPGFNLSAGSGPTQVVTADFNADGKADLAVADGAGNTVTVILGNGDGSFQLPVSYPAGSGPSSLTVADFNADGIADIAVANRNDGSVSIILGNGDGTFAAATPVSVGSSNVFIGSGDFNNDGVADLAVADFNANVVWLLLNNGNGTFAAPVSYPNIQGPSSLTVADFNHDGFADIVVASQTFNSIVIFLGKGDGTFQPLSVESAGTGPQAITSSDFNGDGNLDLVMANQAGNVSVMLGNGNGTFQAPFPFTTGADPVSLAVANFTGNGKAQIAAASLGSNSISILLDGPAALTTYAGNQQTAPAESTFLTPFAVETTGFGNPVSGITVTFTAPSTGASGIFAGAGLVATAVSASNGIATAPYFTANTFAGPYTVTATTGTSPVSLATFSETNTVTACTFTVTPPTVALDENGGSATITITAKGPSCAWNAVSAAPWITFVNPAGMNSGSVTANIAPNSTGVARVGTILVGGQVVTVYEAATTQVFADVPPSVYYFDAINMLYAKGITSGCGTNPLIYCPTQAISRAQMAIFLVRAAFGNDNFTYNPVPYFNDVPVGSFAFPWIQKLFELGITAGCGNGNYCPTLPVTRDEMAIFLIRLRLGATAAFNYPLTPFFTDVSASTFGFQWIQRLKEDQITAGCTATKYCPLNSVTRGDMAILVMRAAFNDLLPPGYPEISQISQSTIGVGQTATLTVTGANTHFVQGTVSLIPLPNITFGPLTVNSPTSLTVQITVSPTAAPQPYSIVAVSGFEEDVLPNGLMVTP